MKKNYLTPDVKVMLTDAEDSLLTASVTETISEAEEQSDGYLGSRRNRDNSLWDDEE